MESEEYKKPTIERFKLISFLWKIGLADINTYIRNTGE